jgi:hypothetical protein
MRYAPPATAPSTATGTTTGAAAVANGTAAAANGTAAIAVCTIAVIPAPAPAARPAPLPVAASVTALPATTPAVNAAVQSDSHLRITTSPAAKAGAGEIVRVLTNRSSVTRQIEISFLVPRNIRCIVVDKVVVKCKNLRIDALVERLLYADNCANKLGLESMKNCMKSWRTLTY